MSNAFLEFKALKIKNLNISFNNNVNNLTIYYNNALNSIKRSRNTNANKKRLIQNLNNEVNSKYNLLKIQLDNDISYINNLVMPEIKNIKNNSALLIGINCTDVLMIQVLSIHLFLIIIIKKFVF